ncbi:MAG TPA: condensation domain-containing protein, partial [Thermoanaerobaculia bacterium]|nr:condensation domain-containing protein [Thermoanaerobaculia bacterium]
DRKALPAPEEDGARLETGESYVAPRTPEERVLAAVWARVLGVERVGLRDNFFALGGDSILSLQIVSQARREGLHLTPKQMFLHQTVEELAAAAETMAAEVGEMEEVLGETPLTPIQAWFFELDPVDRHHWNQAILLEARRTLDAAALESAVAGLVERHDALRMRFARGAAGWEQRLTPVDGTTPFARLDLSALPEGVQSPTVEAAAAALQESLDLTAGPLLRVASFDLGVERPGRLLLIVHHLAVDGVSWRVLLDDLEHAYKRLSRGEAPQPGPRTTSFAHWARRLQEHARSPRLQAEVEHWLAQAPGQIAALPVDQTAGPNTVASARVVTVALGEEETGRLLQDVPRAYRTQINDVLLTALARVLCGWTGSESVLVELEGHGREEILDGVDLSRTVGWFTSIFPVLLAPRGGLEESLKAVKEQLRQVPSRGVGYGLLRYLGDENVADRLRRLPHAEVSFNYLGQLDQTLQADSAFRLAPESSGPSESPLSPRPHLLEVNGNVLGGRLRISWIYSESFHSAAAVEQLAEAFLETLRRLIDHCVLPGSVGYTPSDFPLARLDQAALDRLLGRDAGVEDLYPLSPMQQGILFHALYSPSSVEYFNHLTCRFDGGLDVEAFQAAWRHIVRRQSIFRTAFRWEGLDEPLQVVRRDAEPAWEIDDWRGLGPAEQEARLARFLEEDCARGFDFAAAPLMRMFLFRLGDESWQFVWSHHHLLLDGWSLPVLFNQSFEAYAALVQGREPNGARSRPFRDYIGWLRDQDLARAEAFWRRYLAGFSTPITMRLESGAAPANGGSRYAAEKLLLSLELTAALQERARGHQLTVNTLVQSAWALLLHRYSGSEDVVFGMVVSGRPAELAGMESMIGPFINALPVRVRIDGAARTLDWLRALQEQQAELRQYEYSSLIQIQGWSEVPRGRSLFESSVAFDNYPTGGPSEEPETGVVMRDGRYVDWNSYPISLDVAPHEELSISVKYNVERFDAPAVRRILRDFEIVLRAFAGGFEQSLADLGALLDEADRQERARREEQYKSSLQQKLKGIRRPVAVND